MNKSDRRKLAKAARELAMECIVGTAPEFGTDRLFMLWDPSTPVCVLGHVYFRFHGSAGPPRGLIDWSDKVHDLIPTMTVLVDANNESAPQERHSAVVFPLLAYADELESQS